MSKNDWILDVLADLKTFASANGLRALAEQLDDTRLIAAAEIATHLDEVPARSHGDDIESRSDFRGIGRHQRA